MNFDTIFAALFSAAATGGGAVLAMWRNHKAQLAKAEERKEAAHTDHMAGIEDHKEHAAEIQAVRTILEKDLRAKEKEIKVLRAENIALIRRVAELEAKVGARTARDETD